MRLPRHKRAHSARDDLSHPVVLVPAPEPAHHLLACVAGDLLLAAAHPPGHPRARGRARRPADLRLAGETSRWNRGHVVLRGPRTHRCVFLAVPTRHAPVPAVGRHHRRKLHRHRPRGQADGRGLQHGRRVLRTRRRHGCVDRVCVDKGNGHACAFRAQCFRVQFGLCNYGRVHRYEGVLSSGRR